MREIKFRGKCPTQGWIYGSLINDFNVPAIRYTKGVKVDAVLVHKHTVGQFTGLQDKNGKEIFEGDKLSGTAAGDCIVKWFGPSAGFELYSICSGLHYSMATAHSGEIIGNIHDNNSTN